MITTPDLTQKLNKFCKVHETEQYLLLLFAGRMIKEKKVIIYKGIEYRLLDDLQVDLEAECLEQNKILPAEGL